jgi:hypothetical protein
MTAEERKFNMYECSLQGLVVGKSPDSLVERLRGLCGKAESNFSYQESVYKVPPNAGVPPSELRARMNKRKEGTSMWTLRYLGPPLARDKLTVTARTINVVKVSDNIKDFLDLMGYKLDFENGRHGLEWYTTFNQKKLTVTLSRVFKFDENVFIGDGWVIELAAATPDDGLQETTDAINLFAEYLLPLVDLTKGDRVGLAIVPANPPIPSGAVAPPPVTPEKKANTVTAMPPALPVLLSARKAQGPLSWS